MAQYASSDMPGSVGATASVARTTAPATQTLYLLEQGDTAQISLNDIHQGQIGDCFLLSPIGELALTHPSAISNMIRQNGDGTETVTLHVDSSGHLPSFSSTGFSPIAVTVSNLFPTYSVNNGPTQDVVAGQKEIWPQVLEKAVATLSGGYGAISSGGYPPLAMEELTGHQATPFSPVGLSAAALQNFVTTGDLIVMDTPNKPGLPFNLVSGHAYMFEKLTMSGSTPMVQLGNPWGFDQPTAIPLAQLSRGIAEVDVGRFA